jgi:hypothetical protein
MRVRIMMAAAALAGFACTAAQAAPVCSTTTDIGSSGIVLWSSLSAGDCIKSGDKVYGNFVGGNLPSNTALIFNTNTIGSLVHQQLSFDASYLAGTTYSWGYEVMVDFSTATAGTVITSIDADFTQTASNAPSVLDKSVTPSGDANIHEIKIGAFVQPGSVLTTNFGPNVTDVVISEMLQDNGTISSVTNTITEFVPGRNVPEPLSLSLLAAGLIGFGWTRRRKV